MEHDVIEHTALATEAPAPLPPDTTVGIVEELRSGGDVEVVRKHAELDQGGKIGALLRY